MVDAEQKANYVRIFKSAVNEVSTENVQFVILEPSLAVKIFLQGGITPVDIADVMHLFVLGNVKRLHPNTVKLVRFDNGDTRRNLLSLEASVHFFNGFVGDLLNFRTHTISFFRHLNWDVREINTINAIFIRIAKFFVAVHFRRLGIGCINDGKFTVLHTELQELEKRSPNYIVVGLVDGFFARYGHNRART